MLHIGLGHYIKADQILAVCDLGSEQINNIRWAAKSRDQYFRMTRGKKAKAVLIMNTGVVISTILCAETITKRLSLLGY